MNAWFKLGLAVVGLAVASSAVAVVWSKHESRTAFVKLQRLQSERDALDIEWYRLKLEQGTWSSHGRVEQVARANLKMVIPQPTEVIPVGRGGESSTPVQAAVRP